MLFSYTINIKPPGDESSLINWKSHLEEDTETIQSQDNKNHIVEVLALNDLECYDIDSISQADSKVLNDHIQEIVVSALTFHLMNNKEPEYRNGKLLISSKSLSHGLSFFQEGKNRGKNNVKLETNESTKVLTMYGLQKMFGPNGLGVTGNILYLDLPSNMVGSFLTGWFGVVSKAQIFCVSNQLAVGLSTGYLGSLTIFSGWNQKMIELCADGEWASAVLCYVVEKNEFNKGGSEAQLLLA
ncbi:hypothetical protein AgCh_009282 [Apium graveolens]